MRALDIKPPGIPISFLLLQGTNGAPQLPSGNPAWQNVTVVDCSKIFILGGGPYIGPYLAGSSNTYNGGSADWHGPVGAPGAGYTIYFDYAPAVAEGETAQTERHEWTLVDYDKLTRDELKCARKQIAEAKETFSDDQEKLDIINGIEKKVNDEIHKRDEADKE